MGRIKPLKVYTFLREHIDTLISKLRRYFPTSGIDFDLESPYRKLSYLVENYPIDKDKIIRVLPIAEQEYKSIRVNADLSSKSTIRIPSLKDAIVQVKDIIREFYEQHSEEVPYTNIQLNTLSLYLLAYYYYLILTGKEKEVLLSGLYGVSEDIDLNSVEDIVYWDLVYDENTGLPYYVNEVGTLVVNVANFEPKQTISHLSYMDDRTGYIYDFIFVSAVMTAVSKRLLSVDQKDVVYILDKYLNRLYTRYNPDALGIDDDFRKRFVYFQNILVKTFEELDDEGRKLLKKKLDRIVNLLGHLLYIDFHLNVETTRKRNARTDPSEIESFAVLNIKPGTHWIFGSFLSYIPDEKKVIGAGLRLRDVILFNPVTALDGTNPIITFPTLMNINPRLYDIFASKTTTSGDIFLLLVRTDAIPVNQGKSNKEDEELDEIEKKFVGQEIIRTNNVVLAAVPVNPLVVVHRSSNNVRKRVTNIRETFGFDEPPERMEDVLESLYLLARAYLPDYKHYSIEGRSLLGWDQYLGMIFSTLSYLSPTRVFSTVSKELDTRIHTLLYGFKGTGKSMIIRRLTEELNPTTTVYIDPSQNSTLAGLIGGIEHRQVGRRTVPVYTSGSLIRADGSLVGVDEILELDSDILLLLSYVMSSYTLPRRHIRFNLNAESIKFYASVLAAANPRNETQMYLLYLLHPEMILSIEKTHFASILALLERVTGKQMDETVITSIRASPDFFLKSTIMQTLTDRVDLPDDLKHLVNMTAYDQAQNDFYKRSLSKIFDRFTFVVPMYSKSGSLTDDKFQKSYISRDRIILYDPLLGGAEKIALDDLRAFSSYIQTYSPVYQGTDEDIMVLKDLYSESIKIMENVYRLIDEKVSKAVKASGTASDAASILVRHMGHRFTSVAYRLAHTIIKLYGMDKPNKAIWQAIEYLITNYVRITYLNPLGVTLGKIGVNEYVRTVMNASRIRAEAESTDKYVVLTPALVEEVAKELLSDKQVYFKKYDTPISYSHAIELAVKVLRALGGDIDDAKADLVKVLDKVILDDSVVYRYERSSEVPKLLNRLNIEVQKYRGSYRIYLVFGNTKVRLMEV